MGQEEYLKHLSRNVRKHREIDAFLAPFIRRNLPTILELRTRFAGSSDRWRTPSGVHTKGTEECEALATEVRFSITSEAKAGFTGNSSTHR
jgi:hypothetical protein